MLFYFGQSFTVDFGSRFFFPSAIEHDQPRRSLILQNGPHPLLFYTVDTIESSRTNRVHNIIHDYSVVDPPRSAALSVLDDAPFDSDTRHELGQIQILQVVIADFPKRLEYVLDVARADLLEAFASARGPYGARWDYLVAGSGRVLFAVVPFVFADGDLPVPLVPLAFLVRARRPGDGAF